MVCDDSKPLQRLKVCVIGAGMAGLASARELRREGHDVTVLEQSGYVGGQWLYDPRVDGDDPLGAAAAPVKVHSSMYASLRLISARENMGFTDFQFAAKDGRDGRRFPGHREVYLYLKDFCDVRAHGVRQAQQQRRACRPGAGPDAAVDGEIRRSRQARWCRGAAGRGGVRRRGGGQRPLLAAEIAKHRRHGGVEGAADAQPLVQGAGAVPRRGGGGGRVRRGHRHGGPQGGEGGAPRRQVHGGGNPGARQGARQAQRQPAPTAARTYCVYSVLQSCRSPGTCKTKRLNRGHRIRWVERLCDDGRVVFGDGSTVLADTIIYCTGYDYSFPFLDTEGAVTVDDNRVGPLFEHVFPPSLAPSLSFIGIPIKVFAPWFFEAQARWVAQVLSGTRTLPPEEEMMRSVEEYYHGREIAGAPKKYTHDVSLFDITYINEFRSKYCDFPGVEKWRYELLESSFVNMFDNLETFRDEYQDSDSISKSVEEWHLSAQQAVAAATMKK